MDYFGRFLCIESQPKRFRLDVKINFLIDTVPYMFIDCKPTV